MGGMLACQGLPPSLLHFIMQDQIEPAFCKAMGDVLHRGLRNRKRLGNLGFIPSISQFQVRVRVRAFALPCRTNLWASACSVSLRESFGFISHLLSLF